MTGQEFRDALRSGKTVYGTLITSTSPKMFDLTVSLGLDYVFLCTEHVSYNPETLSWMCRAYKAAGITPVVRILSPDPFLATQALDAGAGAIFDGMGGAGAIVWHRYRFNFGELVPFFPRRAFLDGVEWHLKPRRHLTE